MSDRWTDRLSEYLDEDLAEADRELLEAHLATCSECTGTLQALREVARRGQTLENRAPEMDLWPAIRARIAPVEEPVRRRPFLLRFPFAHSIQLSLPQAMAAGLALMLISGAIVWGMLRGGVGPLGGPGQSANSPLSSSNPAAGPRGTSNDAAGGPVAENQGPAVSPAGARLANGGSTAATGTLASGQSAASAALQAAYDSNYDQAIAELERTLAQHRSELDTSTVRIVEQDLAIIDRAIAQARRALEADPASPYLHQHLALQMQLKLDLLRRTTALAAAQG
jgi:hypothetical protein